MAGRGRGVLRQDLCQLSSLLCLAMVRLYSLVLVNVWPNFVFRIKHVDGFGACLSIRWQGLVLVSSFVVYVELQVLTTLLVYLWYSTWHG